MTRPPLLQDRFTTRALHRRRTLIQRGKSEELSAYRATANLRTDQLMSVIGEPPFQQGVFRYRHGLCAVVGQFQPTAARAPSHRRPARFAAGQPARSRSEAELFSRPAWQPDADPAYPVLPSCLPEAAVAVLAKDAAPNGSDESRLGVVAAKPWW